MKCPAADLHLCPPGPQTGPVFCWPDLPFFFRVVLFVWRSSSSVSFWPVAWLSNLYCISVFSFFSDHSREQLNHPERHTGGDLTDLLRDLHPILLPPFCLGRLQRLHHLHVLLRPWPSCVRHHWGLLSTSANKPCPCRRSSEALTLQSCSFSSAGYWWLWLYLTTLLTISIYYFHAIFASGCVQHILPWLVVLLRGPTKT